MWGCCAGLAARLAQRVALSDAIARYFYYIEVGIRDSAIAPLNEEWPIHVMELVPPEPPRGVSQVQCPVVSARLESASTFPGGRADGVMGQISGFMM